MPGIIAGEISGIGLVAAGIEIRERPDAVVLPGKIRISRQLPLPSGVTSCFPENPFFQPRL
jgi:hypothetical protein